ncbi:BCD family MFS transporter [Pararhodospirillum oryzae]|uniref:Bacteriochlorophyll synthase n=1 Tax=Pararhodospirillum oryzae TaxID=478448 RepID=A0A512HB32_9PROT|nr:BCD family MFS transporter [Pararhodospirillum oryzae]GEO82652.1 bacteriochlorophyll synthase [Pararhodospirillum oryzae]
MSRSGGLGWLGIVRLGLVQSALGAIVVLSTSALNRVMVVEHALPAVLPGALVTLHHALQFLRPRWGYGSDMGGRRTPWIIGGVAILGVGGTLAAVATAWMGWDFPPALALAIVAFILIGIGVGAAGTCLLALLATRVVPERRAAAATIVWMMMIAGFAITAGASGHFLSPYSPERLVAVCGVVAAVALVVTVLALLGVERKTPAVDSTSALEASEPAPKIPFREALPQVWGEKSTRGFAVFVFLSMLAYSAQDLILEPFGGLVFNMEIGETTKLSGLQHSGVFVGMLLVGIAGSVLRGTRLGSLRLWTLIGCLASAIALGGLVVAGFMAPNWPLRAWVFYLGFATGIYAVAAIGSMMTLAGQGQPGREGMRMGVWGAAQAIAMGLGAFLGTVAVDATRLLVGAPTPAYQAVFAAEAVVFVLSAVLAARIGSPSLAGSRPLAQSGPALDAAATETGKQA